MFGGKEIKEMKYVKHRGFCGKTNHAEYNTQDECAQAMKNMNVDPSYVAWHCSDCGYWHFGKPRAIKPQEPSEPTWNEIISALNSPDKEIDKAIKLLIDNGYLVLTPEGKKDFKRVISSANELAKKMRNENDNK